MIYITSRIPSPWRWNMMGDCDAGILAVGHPGNLSPLEMCAHSNQGAFKNTTHAQSNYLLGVTSARPRDYAITALDLWGAAAVTSHANAVSAPNYRPWSFSVGVLSTQSKCQSQIHSVGVRENTASLADVLIYVTAQTWMNRVLYSTCQKDLDTRVGLPRVKHAEDLVTIEWILRWHAWGCRVKISTCAFVSLVVVLYQYVNSSCNIFTRERRGPVSRLSRSI